MPDAKWIKDLFPSTEQVDSFRGSLMDLSEKFRDSLENLELGTSVIHKRRFNINLLVLDPRLKVFGDRKVKELRAWFDNRLEEAIKAAEEESKADIPEGNCVSQLSVICIRLPWLRFIFLNYVYVSNHRALQWIEIVLSCRR